MKLSYCSESSFSHLTFLQMERARSSSDGIHHQQRLMSLGPFETAIEQGVSDPRLLRTGTFSHSLMRAQSFNSSASESFSPVIPRSITPDPHLFSNSSSFSPNLGRRGTISQNGYTYGTSDHHDLAAAISALSLSTNRVGNEANFNLPRQQVSEDESIDYGNYFRLKNMNQSEVAPLHLVHTRNSVEGSSLNPIGNFPLHQRMPNSVNNVMDTGISVHEISFNARYFILHFLLL